MATLINGTDIVVKIGVAGAEDAIFCSTSCTLNITAETVGASCKDGGSWNQTVEGSKSWDIAVDGLYQVDTANGFIELSDLLLIGPNESSIVIGQYTESGDISWQGTAILTSTSLTAPDGEISTWSATFTGTGPLVKVIVAP